MLNNYLRKEEQHYTTTYVQQTMQNFETWKFEQVSHILIIILKTF